MSHHRLPLETKDLPHPPNFWRILGPSFIFLGLGLGSGEIILWPYLTSNHGLGVVWGILVGLTLQFFINMEVERYALVRGESIFVGFARWFRFLPLWFILSTLLGFGWPGIGLAGASLITRSFGSDSVLAVAIIIFVLIGLLLSFGKVLYQTVESLQKTLILIGTPFVLFLAFTLAKDSDWQNLFLGLAGRGTGFNFLPPDLPITSFLAALVFSGAGGNLNLAQSFYIKDKGYGMGVFAQKIKNILSGISREEIRLPGTTFPVTPSNLDRYNKWWKLINLEHFLVFWILGLLTMLSLSLLAYSTVHGLAGNTTGINFVLSEATVIGQRTLPFVGTLFLLVTGLMLSATQLTVLDSTSRIITENILLAKESFKAHVSKLYYVVLWIQILIGILIFLFGFREPRQLITISAVINGFAMLVYTGLLFYVNNFHLPIALRPSPTRNIILVSTFLFLGYFCLLSVMSFNF